MVVNNKVLFLISNFDKMSETALFSIQLREIESYFKYKDVINREVSDVSVGWQVYHMLIVINLVASALKRSDSKSYKKTNNKYKAKYFFSLDILARIEKQGEKAVYIQPGEEIITMSLMKRDTPIYYTGEAGIIHSVYFKPGVSVSQGKPLIGVCAREKLPLIQKIITHVKAEWD